MLSQRTKALLSIIHHTVDTLPTLFSSVRILCNAARSLFLFLVYYSRSTWFARCRAGIRTEHLQMGTKHPCLSLQFWMPETFLFIALWGRMWMWMWMSRTNRVVRGNVDLAAAMQCDAMQPSGLADVSGKLLRWTHGRTTCASHGKMAPQTFWGPSRTSVGERSSCGGHRSRVRILLEA